MHDRHIDIHGHRGARGLFPENTLPAFEAALRLGVNALEMDVVISRDGQVVVSHEAWMNAIFCTRPDGQAVENAPEAYNLYRMDYSEILSYDCGKRGNPQFPFQKAMQAHKPLLREVINGMESCTSQYQLKPIIYNIEIKTEQPPGLFNPKPDVFVDLVYAELKKEKAFQRCVIQSFDTEILRRMRKKDASVQLGLLVENREGLDVNLERLGFMPEVYSPDFEMMERGVVEETHRLGMRFIPWTVNEPKDIKNMIDIGADGIITDYPDRALTFIETN